MSAIARNLHSNGARRKTDWDSEWIHELQTVRLKRGGTVVAQDQPPARFYLVRQGLLAGYRAVRPDKRICVQKWSAGASVVLSALLLDQPFPAQITPLKDTVAFRGDRNDLSGLRRDHPRQLHALLLQEYDSMVGSYRLLEEQLSMHLDQRLARELLELGRLIGQRTDEGIRLTVKLTRKDISRLIGCSHESVIRIMSEWEEKRWLHTESKIIVVRKPSRLRRLLWENGRTTDHGAVRRR